jgi:RNA polymerase sigma-70 factor, ECF subfamily
MDSEAATIQRVLDGDGDGFRVLVDRYSQALFRLSYRMTGSEADAEDVVQETFVRAYRNLTQYDGRANFNSWLYRIASNCALDLMAARKRRAAEPLEGDADRPGPIAVAASEQPSPERSAMSGQIGERLTAAMAQLSPQERTAFVLRHYEDFSIEEIGSSLGVGISAAKHSIFRAVQKLRRALQPVMGRTQ